MAYSRRQHIYAEYLLKKIGFNDSQLIDDYLIKLESIYGKYFKEWGTKTLKNGYSSTYWILRYTNSECIDLLIKEIDIKKNLNSIINENIKFDAKISATDLSSFDFCPASYSIAKSFVIEYPTNEDKRIIGSNLHESLRLIDKIIPDGFKESDFYKNEVIDNEKIEKIKNCKLIFSGHTNENNFFINEEQNFIGQPDYIFRDPNNNYFVVEEKFRYQNNYINEDDYNYEKIINERNKLRRVFFSNHIVQLQSYIDYIKEYNITYGVLIYWFYDFYDELPNIHSVSIKVIKKKEHSFLLNTTLSKLNLFLKEKKINFDIKINPKKCAACSVNKYCAHKTSNLNSLEIPYKKEDLRLKYVEFPVELKKT